MGVGVVARALGALLLPLPLLFLPPFLSPGRVLRLPLLLGWGERAAESGEGKTDAGYRNPSTKKMQCSECRKAASITQKGHTTRGKAHFLDQQRVVGVSGFDEKTYQVSTKTYGTN